MLLPSDNDKSGGIPTSNDWRRLEPLIDAVLDAPADQRDAILGELSDGDDRRRAELAHMVADCEAEAPLLGQPAAERFGALFEERPMPELVADRYRIREELGRGGMATVYVARDVKHGRDVAVKVLRDEVAAALGRARFLREIEIVAQLRHPHIVPLYDSGEAGGLLYYVMPYEEGHSLRERLAREGPLSVANVLVVLRDICDALAYAHGHNVVHRDIKPDNVLLSGRHAMVSDFGIARAVTAMTGQIALTSDGMLLGTPAYMAPEQIAGDAEVDHRADLYAVGILAYELLAGRAPFVGETPQQLLTAHLVQSPSPLSAHRADVPAALEALVMKCLAKQPAERWQSADEMLAALEPLTVPTLGPAVESWLPRLTRERRIRLAVAATLGVGLLGALAVVLTRGSDDPPALALGPASRVTADPGLEVQPTISPDGKYVAYATGNSLRTHIVVRPVAGGRTLRLTNDTTENEWQPRWSPDGMRILFLSRGGVSSAPALGGPARQEISSRPGVIVTAAAWSADGRQIAYVRADSLLARDVAAGTVRLISTTPDLHSCSWSPNDTLIACVAGNSFYGTVGKTAGGPMFGNLAPSRIVVMPVSGGGPESVTDSTSLHQSPAWSPDGRTLYYVSNRQGTRDVYALGVGRGGAFTREAVRLTTGVGAHSVTMSADGTRMIYAVYASSANVWAMPIPLRTPGSDTAAKPLTSGNQTVEGVRISGDRRWLVYDSDLTGNSDVYRLSLAGGEPERLTSSPVDEFRGSVSPNGRELAYHTFQTGKRNVFLLPLDGGPVQHVASPPGHELSMANWSPDGNGLAFFSLSTSTVFAIRRDASGRWSEPRRVATGGWRPEWSPDGRAIAFVSPMTGRIGIAALDSGTQRDLYIPGPGDPVAELATFSADGREIYFKSHDARLRASFWAIAVTGGRPRLLVRFDDPAKASNRFEFASDGKRFYFTVEDRQADVWIAELVRR